MYQANQFKTANFATGIIAPPVSMQEIEKAGNSIREASARLVDCRNEITHLNQALAKAEAHEQELLLTLREGLSTVQQLLPLEPIGNLLHGGQEMARVDR